MRARPRTIIIGLAVVATVSAGVATLTAGAGAPDPGTAPAAAARPAEDPTSGGPAGGTVGSAAPSAASGDRRPARSDAGSGPAAGRNTGELARTAPASVAYLTDRYGIPAAEAARRLALQERSGTLAGTLAARFPAEYGGMWLDQAGGGLLTIGATRPETLRSALAADPDAAHLRVVPVRASLARLTDAATRLARTLGVTAGTDVVVDQRANELVVLSTGADDARLAEALAGAGVPARSQARIAAGTVEKACDPRYCDRAPMRGGIRLDVPRDNGTVGGCTTGFNVRDKNNVDYVLTAGHCVLSSTHTHRDRTWHQYLGPKAPVGYESTNPGLGENAYPNDYAIIPYPGDALREWAYPVRKTGATPSLVNYWCVKDNPRCTGSRDVAITGYVPVSQVKAGWVVCATGSAYTPKSGEVYVDSGAGAGYLPGTRCGEVLGTSTGGIDVRICARPGDSGGPLFTETDGKALGILSYGDDGSGACTNPNEQNHYAGVSTILDRANARTGLGLHLATQGPFYVRPSS
ncbi:trypsin-like serine protease [Micromonospora sp. HK10]|uniref:trypsin-like serine protease n=1 Tax=Micromonospora sp. HK10 TaxID=1538294 RepID=UPI0006978C54|nr:trypsin-like serine protease [Micromonospora sp. HK10]